MISLIEFKLYEIFFSKEVFLKQLDWILNSYNKIFYVIIYFSINFIIGYYIFTEYFEIFDWYLIISLLLLRIILSLFLFLPIISLSYENGNLKVIKFLFNSRRGIYRTTHSDFIKIKDYFDTNNISYNVFKIRANEEFLIFFNNKNDIKKIKSDDNIKIL